MEQSTSQPVTAAAIVKDLRQVLRFGVRPVRLQECARLLALRCVRAGADNASDDQSLAFALEAVLLDALTALGEGPYGEAARLLFGASQETRGRLLKDRRRIAALQLDILPSTFRQNYESDILLDVATEVLRREMHAFRVPADGHEV